MILDCGEFDHHQKNKNGQRENGIYYSSIGLLWKKFGRKYLEKLNVENIDNTFEYIDKELIQYIDATDNFQLEYLESKISPDFVKLCNPEWNEEISEDEAFAKALKLADGFWGVYIKNAIAEVKATEIIRKKIEECKECFLILDKEMPYRTAIKLYNDNKIKYIIFKSRREVYEVRVVTEKHKFKDCIVKAEDIEKCIELTGIDDLIYVDNHAKLCCTKNLNSAIKLVKYNEL